MFFEGACFVDKVVICYPYVLGIVLVCFSCLVGQMFKLFVYSVVSFYFLAFSLGLLPGVCPL